MTKKTTPISNPAPESAANVEETRVEETPFEAVASICSVLVVGLFILTFLGQNFVIPSGSMENTLRTGDQVLVESLTWTLGRTPILGDAVVVRYPLDRHQFFIKRVVAGPGDRQRESAGSSIAAPVPAGFAGRGCHASRWH